jgi:hypothetical protein
MDFKEFLLNEQRAYLGQKVGDILTALHDLRDEAKSMGSRSLVKYSEKVVNQIRRILHQHWPREENKHLKVLQKVAVSLMKAIEENDDLEGVVASAASEMEKLSGKLGVPIHQLGTPDKKSEGPSDEEKGTSAPAQDTDGQPPGGQPGAPPADPMQPPGGPPGAAPPGGPPAAGGPPPGASPLGAPPAQPGL